MIDTPIELFRWFGVGALLLLSTAVTLVLSKRFLGTHQSISAHMAASKRRYLFMGSAITAAAAPFALFALGWLAPTYQVSAWAMVIVVSVFTLAGLVAAWTRVDTERVGIEHNAHMISAGIAGISLGVIIALVAFSSLLTTLGAMLIYVMVSITLIFGYLYFCRPDSRRHFLVYETIYLVVFGINLLVLTLKI